MAGLLYIRIYFFKTFKALKAVFELDLNYLAFRTEG
jgi:hypothetical protein